MNKTVIITGGGTGGHLSVAKSFIDEFYKRDYRIIFIGSIKGQDKQWFENELKIDQKYFLDTRGVVNQNFMGKIKSLFMILQAIIKSANIIKKYNVEKIISVGGFSAAPASLATIILQKELYIHEQNSVMGRLNKITSKMAKEVFSSYFPDSKVKDYPISSEFFKYQRVREDIKTIIFLGGSQGATAINDFALNVASQLKEMGIKIIHQAGKNDFQRIKQEYAKLDLDVDCFDFSTNLIQKMDQADFAVSRSGASTLWELTALGIPTLFIPYPYAAANHQYHNAKFLLDKKLAFLQTQDQLDSTYLFNILRDINVKNISLKLTKQIDNNAIKNIVDIIENLN